MYSLQQSVEFEEIANPHSWFLVASELHEQAQSLMDSASSTITRRNLVEAQEVTWNASNRTVILLAGFALENIIKAYLIYEDQINKTAMIITLWEGQFRSCLAQEINKTN
jgi:hypothetical protein